ncbi:LysR family transcriptional regulator [Nitratireductor indicus]|uniref:LysR family transcriptional regulator n=1 Tax=Nitratireductor indicus C115 TaxID=1231190 RepID=K2NQ38_9HYPH|nr:LysR family transcriptional regulator [Nitratireductor indicus]EKF41465.1 LysR family transcriptional regulator [Nitratireductor indicus C115]MDS1138380.1 LysR family transcriptional regulator [Nitratireductor indicus]SFQ71610.1 DNA-binding transcriptional regulator, LysR family [Nitratireductor indicus]
MITFKQLEAIYWITELGSFAAAADRLNTTQSAISKRVQELEQQFSVEIFDRSKRTARLTEKGQEILHYAKSLLEERDNFIERISSSQVLIRHFRLGVTELTAMTWLPQLVKEIKTEYPRVSIEPEVELSATLFDRLMDDTIDLIVIPDVFNDSRCVSVPLKAVENAWMGVPELHTGEEPLSLKELSNFTMLVQGTRSGTGLVYGRWLSEHNITPSKTIHCESMLAQIGFTVSGLGVSYLPVPVASQLVQDGRLKHIPTQTRLPHVRYAVLYRHDRSSNFKKRIAEMAQQCCDFRTFFAESR